MESLLTFLENPTSNAVIIIVVIAFAVRDIPAVARYIPFFKKVNKISDVQDEKYPQIEKMLRQIEKSHQDIITFQTNHSMHEIPEIVKKLDKMDIKLDSVIEKQAEHGERISRIEGKLE